MVFLLLKAEHDAGFIPVLDMCGVGLDICPAPEFTCTVTITVIILIINYRGVCVI